MSGLGDDVSIVLSSGIGEEVLYCRYYLLSRV